MQKCTCGKQSIAEMRRKHTELYISFFHVVQAHSDMHYAYVLCIQKCLIVVVLIVLYLTLSSFYKPLRCQVCPDVHFMPDVNNCCECLPCAECDDIQNNTVVVPCSHTSNTVCTRQNDPPSRAPSDCPWIQSTTQAPTSEAAGVNTPSRYIYYMARVPLSTHVRLTQSAILIIQNMQPTQNFVYILVICFHSKNDIAPFIHKP